MPSSPPPSPQGLSPTVERILADLVESARECFQDDLRSVVLFGSGAEGRLRATSDLNLLIVLARFDKDRVDAFRGPLRVARMAGRAAAMFVLASELPAAAEAFSVKFDDMSRRRRVLFGDDVLAGLDASRESKRRRLCQVLLNLALRLRQQYAALSLQEEQLASRVADVAGPLRSAAATLLELEGQTVASPKQALETVAADWKNADGPAMLHRLSQAREETRLPPDVAGPLMFQLMALAEEMRRRAERIA